MTDPIKTMFYVTTAAGAEYGPFESTEEITAEKFERLCVRPSERPPVLEAEVMFHDAKDVPDGIEALRENGCKAEIIEGRVDPYSTATWVKVTYPNDGMVFCDWLALILEFHPSDVLEADPCFIEADTNARETAAYLARKAVTAV